MPKKATKAKTHDIVEEASEESFPASDAPAWGTKETMAPKPDHNTAEMLLHEHQTILQMIKAMDHLVEDLQRNKPIPKEKISKTQEFIRTFVEDYHHRKERRSLICAVRSGKIKANEYPRTLFKQEHKKAQKLEQELDELSTALPNNIPQNDQLIKLLLEIKGLYFSHIQHEEQLIFPLIKTLDKDFQESLYLQMQKIEKQFGPEIQKHIAQITQDISK
jgi:hemerythrin-like domain-containing protein